MRYITPSRLALISVLFVFLTVSALASEQTIISETSTAQIEEILKTEGYSYEIDEDGDFLWKLEGFRTLLIIASNRESITFRAAFNDSEATLETVNEWNKVKKYSKTYLDDEKDPILEIDLDLAGGVTRERILDFLVTCRISLVDWVKDVVRSN